MVCKCTVLLRVKHLKQCTCWISAIIFRKLIYFIKNYNRIGNAAAFNPFHDPSRHSADISSSVTADLSFITDSTKTDTHVFTVKRTGNTLSDTCLTGTRRTDKKEDGTILFPVQCHNSNLLDDTFFDFLKSIMIFIKNLFCPV